MSSGSHPLSLWNDGKARNAILRFVAATTAEGGADIVVSMKDDWNTIFSHEVPQ